MTDLQIEQIFAISHILREFGFHKESTHYFVKPKGEQATLLKINLANFWNFKHYDWNKAEIYKPSMGKAWNAFGRTNYPIFSAFEKPGYICTVPNDNQILSFAERHGFKISIKSLSDIILDLIVAYREKKKDDKAFEKYKKLI